MTAESLSPVNFRFSSYKSATNKAFVLPLWLRIVAPRYRVPHNNAIFWIGDQRSDHDTIIESSHNKTIRGLSLHDPLKEVAARRVKMAAKSRDFFGEFDFHETFSDCYSTFELPNSRIWKKSHAKFMRYRPIYEDNLADLPCKKWSKFNFVCCKNGEINFS